MWETGNPANRMQGVQTYTVGPAGGAILDMIVDQETVIPIVTHPLTDALRGAIALLQVTKDAEQLALMPSVAPLAATKLSMASEDAHQH